VKLVREVMVVRPHGIHEVLRAGQVLHQLRVLSPVMQEGDGPLHPAVLLDWNTVDQQLHIPVRLLTNAKDAFPRLERIKEKLLGKDWKKRLDLFAKSRFKKDSYTKCDNNELKSVMAFLSKIDRKERVAK